MSSEIVGKIVVDAAREVEAAVHKAMNRLVMAQLDPIEVTAALSLARILKAAPAEQGLALLADASDEFLRGVLQKSCDFAGMNCTVQLEMPQTQVRKAH